MNNYIIKDGELYHHGVKGMKWGIRRYQNPDGSLTPAGKKRYDNMSDDRLRKTLSKQVRKVKTDVTPTIGIHTKKEWDRYVTDYKKYEGSDARKRLNREGGALDALHTKGKISTRVYEERYAKLLEKYGLPPELDRSKTFQSVRGRTYSQEFLNTYGKQRNIAALKDLGYNEKVAKQLTERILKSKEPLLL